MKPLHLAENETSSCAFRLPYSLLASKNQNHLADMFGAWSIGCMGYTYCEHLYRETEITAVTAVFIYLFIYIYLFTALATD
jgi:hypothetical protein